MDYRPEGGRRRLRRVVYKVSKPNDDGGRRSKTILRRLLSPAESSTDRCVYGEKEECVCVCVYRGGRGEEVKTNCRAELAKKKTT